MNARASNCSGERFGAFWDSCFCHARRRLALEVRSKVHVFIPSYQQSRRSPLCILPPTELLRTAPTSVGWLVHEGDDVRKRGCDVATQAGAPANARHPNHAHSKRAQEEEGERLREAAGCAPGRLVGCIRTAPGSILWPSHASAHRPAWYRAHGNLYGSRRDCRGFRGQVHARRSARRGRCARLSDAALVLLLREAGERAKQALSEVQQVR